MPHYTFKKQFVPFLLDGSKIGTIRRFRKYAVRKDQLVSFYTGPRFKPQVVMQPKPVADVKVVYITNKNHVYIINTNWIDPVERQIILETGIIPDRFEYIFLNKNGVESLDEFAYQDGFRGGYSQHQKMGCFFAMLRFWRETNSLPFIGTWTIWGAPHPLTISE